MTPYQRLLGDMGRLGHQGCANYIVGIGWVRPWERTHCRGRLLASTFDAQKKPAPGRLLATSGRPSDALFFALFSVPPKDVRKYDGPVSDMYPSSVQLARAD